MPDTRDRCLVLWADRFDEVAAVVFVAELRRVGLRVQLVGLPGPGFVGIHGLALAPDLTLDQALDQVERAACIVAPCDSPALARAGNDPRLWELLELAHEHSVRVIAAPAAAPVLAQADGGVATYSEGASFHRQVRRLARQLVRRAPPSPLPQLAWQGV